MENEMILPVLKMKIALALAKVQGAIIPPKKDTDNPFFKSKYADLAGVWESVRPLLTANELAFVQLPTTEGAKVSVTGMLLHSSGESIESTITGNAKDAMPQSIGSCITYLRRYQMSAMLGIAAEDDDGAAASGTIEPKGKSKAQERPGFSTGIPMEQHQADERAKADAVPQIDKGSFEDRIKNTKVLKKGSNERGPWTLYSVETEGNGAYATYDDALIEVAAKAVQNGETLMIHTEPTPKGPKLVGLDVMVKA